MKDNISLSLPYSALCGLARLTFANQPGSPLQNSLHQEWKRWNTELFLKAQQLVDLGFTLSFLPNSEGAPARSIVKLSEGGYDVISAYEDVATFKYVGVALDWFFTGHEDDILYTEEAMVWSPSA